ncbi:hemolysin III family protein [Peredibacter sp. HCB2-198]|uniref:PAQR family membrane homeostasis protein TrhA n=1 Tax=Peredibacter sp. HCB2-198 TaxID=3383025 RepID=UPI0038B4BE60
MTTGLKKPLLRGHIHQESFFCSLGACSMLVAKASNSHSLIASLAYSGCLIALFGISALYHRPNWDERKRAILRRIDHSAIFLLIAGCFTPVCLLALPETVGLKLLAIVYVAVLFGIVKCIFWTNAPKWLSCILYGCVLFLFVPYLKEFNQGLGFLNMVLIWMGCIVYSIGAMFYAFKRPNFFPNVFGHHELFHAFTVVGAVLHFIVMYRLIT